MHFRQWLLIIIISAVLLLFMYFVFTPEGKEIWSRYQHTMHKTDEITDKQRKEVENTCRALIASWESDIQIYEQYKNSESKEEREIAEQAKLGANETADEYNKYILNNGYVWNGQMPWDIYAVIDHIRVENTEKGDK